MIPAFWKLDHEILTAARREELAFIMESTGLSAQALMCKLMDMDCHSLMELLISASALRHLSTTPRPGKQHEKSLGSQKSEAWSSSLSQGLGSQGTTTPVTIGGSPQMGLGNYSLGELWRSWNASQTPPSEPSDSSPKSRTCNHPSIADPMAPCPICDADLRSK